jgi:predicted CoA-binding protein
MEKLVEEMLAQKVWAVIGASANKEKFGYKIFKKLESTGYTVYPINPFRDRIEQAVCYPSLSALPQIPDVINFVVRPSVGIKIMEEAKDLGIKRMWFQPGAESQEIIQKASDEGLDIVYNDCVLLALG